MLKRNILLVAAASVCAGLLTGQAIELTPSTVEGVEISQSPYTVRVANTGSRQVVLFVIRWDAINPRTGTPTSTWKIQDLRTVGTPLDPGQAQSVDLTKLWLKDLAVGSTIHISLDSVAFSDGEFKGPNATGIFADLNALREVALALFSDLQKMDGQPDQSVLDWLEQKRQAHRYGEGLLLLELKGHLLLRGRSAFQAEVSSLYARYSTEPKFWKAPA
jgi:hypothetical protein